MPSRSPTSHAIPLRSSLVLLVAAFAWSAPGQATAQTPPQEPSAKPAPAPTPTVTAPAPAPTGVAPAPAPTVTAPAPIPTAPAPAAAAPAPTDECVQRDGRTCILASGVRYEELRAGKGETPRPGAKILVHYTGRFPSGKVFDSSRGKKPWSFVWGKGQVIPGYELGLATARVGARRKLTVPPMYAYGEKGFKKIIPPNATLVFDVELLSVK